MLAGSLRRVFLGIGVAILCIVAFPAEAKAGDGTRAAIRRCVQAGLCVLAFDATTTWMPTLPMMELRTKGDAEPARFKRPGGAVFPIGFALDLRLDSERFFVPLFGFGWAFAPNTSTTIHAGKRRIELDSLRYMPLLLPGIGGHIGGEDGGTRVSISARAVYSEVALWGTATRDGKSAHVQGRGVHGWGALVSMEVCRDIIGARRGLCGFVHGTQAYSAGLQHAVTGGFRVVF